MGRAVVTGGQGKSAVILIADEGLAVDLWAGTRTAVEEVLIGYRVSKNGDEIRRIMKEETKGKKSKYLPGSKI